MKVSNYIKTYPYEEGYLVLFSPLSSTVVLIEEELWERMNNGTLSSEEIDMLAGMGILVEDIEIEKNNVYNLNDKRNAANNTVNIVSVMNLDCNLSCIYCYEGDLKGKLYMEENIANLLVDFISRQLSSEKKTLNIDFYGGEPLLSLDLIKYISRKAQSLAKKKGVEYRFTLVTNGTFLTRKTVDELVPLGLMGAKFTLDGPRENHDAFRPFKTGKGSFDVILRNIKDICGKIKVVIGGNFSKTNYHLFPKLLDFLITEGLTPDKISSVKFDPIAKQDNRPPGADFQDSCMSINEPWLFKAFIHLRGEILKRGFNTPPLSPSSCIIYDNSHVVVNFDGSLYKCPGFIGKYELQAGSLAKGVSDYSATYAIDSWRNRQCMDCEYLPLCFGGCRYMKFLRDGNMDGIECRKQYFDETLEAFIKQDIEYRLKACD